MTIDLTPVTATFSSPIRAVDRAPTVAEIAARVAEMLDELAAHFEHTEYLSIHVMSTKEREIQVIRLQFVTFKHKLEAYFKLKGIEAKEGELQTIKPAASPEEKAG